MKRGSPNVITVGGRALAHSHNKQKSSNVAIVLGSDRFNARRQQGNLALRKQRDSNAPELGFPINEMLTCACWLYLSTVCDFASRSVFQMVSHHLRIQSTLRIAPG